MSLATFRLKMESCVDVAKQRFAEFRKKEKYLPECCKMGEFKGGFAVHFSIIVPGYPKIKKISLSACKLLEWDDITTKVLETALIGEEDDVIYEESLGYHDVLLHDSDDDVLKEIQRLAKAYLLT